MQERHRVFIGDVQGCADELDDLLKAIQYDSTSHELWFVGDLVNRGPASLRALRRVIELEANSVLGNHDLHLLRVANRTRALQTNDTFQDILEAPDRETLLAWLRNRPLIKEWEDLVLVHAGLHPMWKELKPIVNPLETAIRSGEINVKDPNLRFLVSARFCSPTGDLPCSDQTHNETTLKPWDHFYQGHRTVVCGHWAARGLVKKRKLRSIDTGCVWGKSLTAWFAENDHCVSVPARTTYQRIRPHTS